MDLGYVCRPSMKLVGVNRIVLKGRGVILMRRKIVKRMRVENVWGFVFEWTQLWRTGGRFIVYLNMISRGPVFEASLYEHQFNYPTLCKASIIKFIRTVYPGQQCYLLVRHPHLYSESIISRLDGESEEGCVVTPVRLHLLLSSGIFVGSLVGKVSAGVFAAKPDGHEDGKDAGHGSSAEKSAVAGSVVGSIILAEDEARDGTTEVTEANMHGNTDTTLEGTTDVVTVPCDTLGNVGVDAGGDHEASKVLDRVVLNSEEESEANHTVNVRCEAGVEGVKTYAMTQKPTM